MSNCYLCGNNNATHKLKLKDSFTAHSLAKCPESNKLCDRCEYSLNLRAYYFNPNKQKFSILYARNWSWLYQDKKLLFPTFNGEKDGFPVVENLPTREQIRGWLIEPPEPPFTIAIAESGQKHILFLAQESQSKELFPVQFELDTLIVKRLELIKVLTAFEQLMGLGATKTEILSGCYKSQFLINNLSEYQEFEDVIVKYRGGRFLELINYVAVKKEIIKTTKQITIEAKETPSLVHKTVQLSLFN